MPVWCKGIRCLGSGLYFRILGHKGRRHRRGGAGRRADKRRRLGGAAFRPFWRRAVMCCQIHLSKLCGHLSTSSNEIEHACCNDSAVCVSNGHNRTVVFFVLYCCQRSIKPAEIFFKTSRSRIQSLVANAFRQWILLRERFIDQRLSTFH